MTKHNPNDPSAEACARLLVETLDRPKGMQANIAPDGVIDRLEWVGSSAAFSRIDSNANGSVSQAELVRALAQMPVESRAEIARLAGQYLRSTQMGRGLLRLKVVYQGGFLATFVGTMAWVALTPPKERMGNPDDPLAMGGLLVLVTAGCLILLAVLVMSAFSAFNWLRRWRLGQALAAQVETCGIGLQGDAMGAAVLALVNGRLKPVDMAWIRSGYWAKTTKSRATPGRLSKQLPSMKGLPNKLNRLSPDARREVTRAIDRTMVWLALARVLAGVSAHGGSILALSLTIGAVQIGFGGRTKRGAILPPDPELGLKIGLAALVVGCVAIALLMLARKFDVFARQSLERAVERQLDA